MYNKICARFLRCFFGGVYLISWSFRVILLCQRERQILNNIGEIGRPLVSIKHKKPNINAYLSKYHLFNVQVHQTFV